MDPTTTSLPALAFQRSLVLRDLVGAALGADVLQCLVRYPRPIGGDGARKALATIVGAQPLLRLSFDASDPLSLVRIIHEHIEDPIETITLNREVATHSDVLQEFLVADRRRSFSLSRPPLFRVTLINPDDPDESLLLTAHSMLLDRDSLQRLAQSLVNGLKPAHAPSPPSRRLRREPTGSPIPISGASEEWFWRPRLTAWSPTVLTRESRTSAPPIAEPMAVISDQLIPAATRALSGLAESPHPFAEVASEVSWAWLLSKIARTESPAFGSWIESLESPGPFDFGVFGNLLPRVIPIKTGSTIGSLLQETTAERAIVANHADVSIVELADWAGLKRGDLLFDSVIRSNRATLPDDEHGPISLVLWEQADVSLVGTVHVWTGRLEIAYRANEINAGVAKSWLALWRGAFETVLTGREKTIDSLNIVSVEAKRLVIEQWNNTVRTFPGSGCVHELIEPAFSVFALRDAIRYREQRMSYRELDLWSKALASELVNRGIGRDDRVALCLERSLVLPASVLGILRSGAAYVPIDPSYPAARIRSMIDQSAPRALITSATLRTRLGPFAGPVILADGEPPQAALSEFPPSKPATPDSLAYVIFTSGSTGFPKGVAMVHGALSNLIQWQIAESIGLPSEARTLQFASLSFDVSFQEIFSTWAAGGTLIMVDDDDRRDPAVFWDLIETFGIHRLFLPFVALQQLAEEAERRESLPLCLREVITAGEQLQASRPVRSLFRRMPHCLLVNQYGPSETHVVTALKLPPDPNTWPTLPPIGAPIANAHAYVLDEQRRVLPIGVPGEIFLGGACLARGYLNQPEMTQDRFENIDLGEAHSERLYRTGDLGRWNEAGQLEFLGRGDHQIKIRGFRVEVGEIETLLLQHPAVRVCAVQAFGEGVTRALIAFVVAHPGTSDLVHSLRQHLSAGLPDYMVPRTYVFLDHLPLTPSGKVDRRNLYPPAHVDTPRECPPAVSADPLESDLIRIWGALLPGVSIGVTDRFFDLGGTSLLAVRMRRELETLLSRRVAVTTIFQNPTIQSLAQALQTPDRDASRTHSAIQERATRQRENTARRRPIASLRR